MGRILQATVGAQPGDNVSCGGGYAVQENYSYTSGGLVTSKGYVYGQWAGSSLRGTAPGIAFNWDTEGHMTGYGTFSYTLDSIGRPTMLTDKSDGRRRSFTTSRPRPSLRCSFSNMRTRNYSSSAGTTIC